MPALAKRRIDLIKLLQDAGANPNSPRNRENAIHIAVTAGCLDCVKALVETGADVNAKTKDGKNAAPFGKTACFRNSRTPIPLIRGQRFQ
ncbi:ankyrin repeat domain-containing protein [Mesorhizobium sp. 128a]